MAEAHNQRDLLRNGQCRDQTVLLFTVLNERVEMMNFNTIWWVLICITLLMSMPACSADPTTLPSEKQEPESAVDTTEDETGIINLSEETTDTPSIEVETEDDEPLKEDNLVADPMTNSMDGALMVYIPEGEFLMGSRHGWNDEGPEHTVYLDAFWIYQHEVTNENYQACMDDNACSPPGSIKYFSDPNYKDHPVLNGVWLEAVAYCQWAGERLPTEAEWEKAARGTDGRDFPWGSQKPTCNLANFKDCVGGTSPVGSYPAGASPFGALDMAGNVGEWVADWHEDDYYSRSPYENPTGPETGTHKVIRGGSWDMMGWGWLTTYTRVVNIQNNELGFRCVHSP
jgi:formylglycine-generating enzyme required for sulfatase activity